MNVSALPFSTIKIRVAALILRGDTCLMFRKEDTSGNITLTTPGGNVETGEDVTAALWREIKEETGLIESNFLSAPTLCSIQDHMVSRPGPTPPPRKLHFIFSLILREDASITETALDEGHPVWISLSELGAYHTYPPVQADMLSTKDYRVALRSFNDRTYQWRR